MKNKYIFLFFIICFFFCDAYISRGQTGCDLAAIRAAFAAPGHYTELTGVSGQPCSMYFVNTTSQDADLSEQQAQTLGAHMAVFNSAAENSAVTTALYATYSGAIWVGYKRSGIAATTFYAMDGSSGNFTPGAATAGLYQNWAGGEPNNSGYNSCGSGCAGSIFFPCVDVYKCNNGEQCTQIYSAGTWNDLPCNTSSISVIEVNLCPTTTINPSATTICGGGGVSLPAGTILGSAPYSYSWTSSPAGFTSTSANPTATPSVNTTYSVTATDRYGCTSTASVTIYVVPTTVTISGVNAATCIGACDGSATASASGGTGTGAYAYEWDTSPVQTSATATGLCAGTYVCTVTKGSCVPSGSELVNNGNFSSGNTGFTSTYGYVADGAGTSELNPEGKYSIVTGNASQVHGSFTGTGRGGGSFMVINGAGTANTTVWCQTINVIANTDYEFSAWLSTMYTTSPAMLQFSFNGVNTGSIFTAPATTNTWAQFFSSWNSGVNTSANICVVNQNTATSGNDFALDDISFKQCVPACQDTAMVVITESGITVPPITPATICANGNATLTAVPSGGTGTYTYSWLPAGTGSTASVTVSPSATTTYTLNVTDGNACAAPPVEVTVTVNNSLNVMVNSASLCFAESATLIASGASTYSWSPATYLSSAAGASVVCTPTADITYTVTGSSGGCVGTAVSTVTINPTPDSDAGADITICSGATGSIGAPSTPGYLYSWSPATDLSSSTAADPTVSPTNFTGSPVSISYIITTSPAGCFSTDTVIVTVNPSLDPTFNYSSSTFCQSGGGANPSPTIITSGGTFTFTPVGLSMDANTGLIDLALSTLGTYTVTYSHNIACPSSSSTTITITNLPNANFSFGTYCQNDVDPIPIFPLGSSSGVFSAATGLVFVSPVTTPGEVDLSASTAGTYTVTNTIAAGGGCPAAVASNTITINAIPIITVNDQTVCAGDTATLTPSGATTYFWSNGTSADTLSDNPGTTTPYTVTGTSAGCSSSATGTVFVNPIPVTTVTDATVCSGLPATLTAGGATTYLWSDGSSANSLTDAPVTTSPYSVIGTSLGCSSSAIGTINVNPIPVVSVNDPAICVGNSTNLTAVGADTYLWSDGTTANPKTVSPASSASYTVTGTALGCSASDVASVTITLLPVITVNSPAICAGQSAILTASGGSVYDWQTGETANFITVSPLTTTTYTVGDNTPGCSGSTISTVTVNSLPVVTVNAATVCGGQSATLTASGANTYLWSTGSAANPLTVSPASPTSYTVTGITAAGCTATAPTTVTVNSLPLITVNSTSICGGLSSVLTASGAVAYVWSNGNVTASITVSPTSTTPYMVTGTDVNGCSGSGIGSVTVFPKPGAQFNTSPNPAGMFNPVIAFNNQSTSDVNYWYWSFGDGDSLDNNTESPTHTYPGDTGSYIATLIVHNAGFCYDTINHLILIGPEYSFYIPNAFTPDGDGINDAFFGKGTGILEYQLMVFDRWGNFIFVSDDINKGWDGRANQGVDVAQQDVYVWKVALTDIFKKKHNYTGTVSIIRGGE